MSISCGFASGAQDLSMSDLHLRLASWFSVVLGPRPKGRGMPPEPKGVGTPLYEESNGDPRSPSRAAPRRGRGAGVWGQQAPMVTATTTGDFCRRPRGQLDPPASPPPAARGRRTPLHAATTVDHSRRQNIRVPGALWAPNSLGVEEGVTACAALTWLPPDRIPDIR